MSERKPTINMAMATLLLILAADVANAGATPDEVAAMDPTALRKLNPVELCNAWHAHKLDSVRAELERRYGFNRQTWWAIGRGFPDSREFMTYSHIVCMWGMPHQETREPTSMGVKRRLTYRMEGHVFHVYLLNDSVTASDERPE
jgi:hypothetical protein